MIDIQEKQLTANDEGFSPDNDTMCDGYWFLIDIEGAIWLFETHLIDDDWSPSGYCWDCYAYVLETNGRWYEIDGGQWFGYSDAREVLREFPGTYVATIELTADGFEVVREGFSPHK